MMKAIIFDLDYTIADTHECELYLRNKNGRDVICELIKSSQVNISLVDVRFPEYISDLKNNPEVEVFFFSDSPREYCLTVLECLGINIEHEHVLGNQRKPCVDFPSYFRHYESVLVIGDSPKDIYFAHKNNAVSIYFTPKTKFNIDFVINNAFPTYTARDFDELNIGVNKFLTGSLTFKRHDFNSSFIMVDFSTSPLFIFNESDIGFAKEYNPDFNNFRGKEDFFVWNAIHRCIKPAKNLTHIQLNNNESLSFLNSDKSIKNAQSFKSQAGHLKSDFIRWAENIGLSGNVYLVPIPGSSPYECHLSFPMLQLVKWWVNWINQKQGLPYKLHEGLVVERFWPSVSAHLQGGAREIRPHLKTMGIFSNSQRFLPNSTVVILDDVVTSGSQMNAVATLLTQSGFLPSNTRLYGFALAKTVRATQSWDLVERLVHQADNLEH